MIDSSVNEAQEGQHLPTLYRPAAQGPSGTMTPRPKASSLQECIQLQLKPYNTTRASRMQSSPADSLPGAAVARRRWIIKRSHKDCQARSHAAARLSLPTTMS
jgi:hypothetical protein